MTNPTTASSSGGSGSTWLGGEVPRTAARDTTELSSVGLGVKKTDREALRLSDKKSYYKVRETAILGMTTKFTLLKGIDEKATVEHLESVYSIVTRFEDLRTQVIANDMIDVFSIPSSFDSDANGNSIPSTNATKLDLFSDSNKASIELVQKANAYFLEFGANFHGENVIWSGEKILNSCDSELRDKLVESTRSWTVKFRGGPTYLKLLLGLILSTSEKSLRALTDKLQIIRITDFPGENASKAVSFIRGASLILTNNDAEPMDMISLVLRTFSVSTCVKFRIHIDNIDSLFELGQLTGYTLDKLLTSIDKKYIELVSRNEWTPLVVSPTQSSSFFSNSTQSILRRLICFNCGALGHAVAECPLPQNEEHIEMRKAIMSEYGKPKPDRKKPNNPLLVPPQKGEDHVRFFNGTKKFWCGKRGCRKWTDHPTSEHPPSGDHATATPATVATSTTSSDPSSTPTEPSPPSTVNPSSTDSVSAYSASMLHFG